MHWLHRGGNRFAQAMVVFSRGYFDSRRGIGLDLSWMRRRPLIDYRLHWINAVP